MMADIMFTKKQYDDAIYHYQQLLQNRPDHYEVNYFFILLKQKLNYKVLPGIHLLKSFYVCYIDF